MKKSESEIGLEFEGAVEWGKPFRYAVFADLFDNKSSKIIGGTRIANFSKKKFAKKCCDQVNEIDSRYKAHIFKKPLLKRLKLEYYAIKRNLR